MNKHMAFTHSSISSGWDTIGNIAVHTKPNCSGWSYLWLHKLCQYAEFVQFKNISF